jgi:predicted nucleic acid-binding protein
MERRRWTVFLDTSALIAGIISPTGAAHELLRLCEAKVIDLVVSRQVLVEADRNISEKLPGLLADFRDLLPRLSPRIVEDPPSEETLHAAEVINRKDASILAAARRAGIDYLVTWNTRHFQRKSVRAFVQFRIVTPGEFLEDFRRAISQE